MKTRTGSARWMGTPDKQDLLDGTALLQITTRTGSGLYWVFSNGKQTRLMKKGGQERYTVRGGKCDCPDARKGNDCKHARAIKAAIPKIAA